MRNGEQTVDSVELHPATSSEDPTLLVWREGGGEGGRGGENLLLYRPCTQTGLTWVEGFMVM